MVSKWSIGAFAASLAIVSGCVTTPNSGTLPTAKVSRAAPATLQSAADEFASTQPSELQPFFRALYIEGEHNAVLNFDYLGLAALESGHYETAAKAFDAAITRIETIYANNPSAQRAKSLFAAEKVKDFKGEPYERAMTYFYRGLLYARVGDYENARASFLSAEAQSMMSESESYQSTFGLMDFLAGWASHCDADDARAEDLGARAAKIEPKPFSSYDDKVSYVELVDVGIGPVKYGTGKYHERLSFRPYTAGSVPQVNLSSANGTVGAYALGADLNYQAMTRDGRPVDAILNGKAQWKSATSATSSALTAAGYAATLAGAATGNSNLVGGGEIGMAVGLFGGLVSRTMTPQADTRAWMSLPAGEEIATGALQATATPAIAISGGNSAIGGVPLNARVGRCAISWIKTTSLLQFAAAQVGAPKPAESGHAAENQALRAFLESTFPAEHAETTAASAVPPRTEQP